MQESAQCSQEQVGNGPGPQKPRGASFPRGRSPPGRAQIPSLAFRKAITGQVKSNHKQVKHPVPAFIAMNMPGIALIDWSWCAYLKPPIATSHMLSLQLKINSTSTPRADDSKQVFLSSEAKPDWNIECIWRAFGLPLLSCPAKPRPTLIGQSRGPYANACADCRNGEIRMRGKGSRIQSQLSVATPVTLTVAVTAIAGLTAPGAGVGKSHHLFMTSHLVMTSLSLCQCTRRQNAFL